MTMTPGFAKPRAELPWLPYPEKDRMFVINAHNFPDGFSPAVNGKMPIAAWIPSRDDAGNGTTTLTDLVGSNSGTLTNMDAATDWVADTGAGGVRALDFDGTNDNVIVGSGLTLAGNLTFSLWVFRRQVSGTVGLFGSNLAYQQGIHCYMSTTFGVNFGYLGSAYSEYQTAADGVLPLNTWSHLIVRRNSTTTTIFVNGVQATLRNQVGTPTSPTSRTSLLIGRLANNNAYGNMRIDDFRIWDQVLDTTDIADLYASGNGRGIDAS